MIEEIENKIIKKLTERLKMEKLSELELYQIIKNEVRNRNYLKENWQVDYAIKRIKEKIKKQSQSFNTILPKTSSQVAYKLALYVVFGIMVVLIMTNVDLSLILLPFVLIFGGILFLTTLGIVKLKEKINKSIKKKII